MWYTILVLLALDIGGLLLVYVLLRDRVRRATTAEAQVAEIRDEMGRLVVELNQTTDRNIALIEDRIASLNDLLAAADKKIGLLHREMEKHDVGTQVYSRLVEGRQVRSVAPPERTAEPQGPAPAAARGPGTPGAGAPAPSAPPSPLAVELSEMPPRQPERRRGQDQGAQETPDLQQRVLMLHRAGFAASLIASRVGAPLGEVELIISLEQRKGSA
jgi:hypothetical protein